MRVRVTGCNYVEGKIIPKETIFDTDNYDAESISEKYDNITGFTIVDIGSDHMDILEYNNGMLKEW